MDELYHYGVLGMKWGKRRALRNEVRTEMKGYRKSLYGKNLTVRQANKKAREDMLKKAGHGTEKEKIILSEIKRGQRTANRLMTRSVFGLKAYNAIKKDEDIKRAGRSFVEAYYHAKGHTDIEWED